MLALTLDAVYRSAIRFIRQDSYRTHHRELYEKTGWSSLVPRRHQHTCAFIYKALLFELLRYFTSLVEFRACNHDTRSQDRLALKVLHANSNLGRTGHYLKLETLILLTH